MSALKEEGQKGLEESSKNSQKSIEELKNSTQEQIHQISDMALSDLKSTVSELKSSTVDFSKELKDSISQSSTEIKNVGIALDAGEKIGKYRNILPLLQLIDGSTTQDESEALIAMWNLSSRFNAWLENHYPGEKKQISDPLTRLLESINDEIQRVGGA
jgi:gas vesicle protein